MAKEFTAAKLKRFVKKKLNVCEYVPNILTFYNNKSSAKLSMLMKYHWRMWNEFVKKMLKEFTNFHQLLKGKINQKFKVFDKI